MKEFGLNDYPLSDIKKMSDSQFKKAAKATIWFGDHDQSAIDWIEYRVASLQGKGK